MALSEVGEDYTLTTVNDAVVAASICNLWWENTRQVVLRAAHWKCAKRIARLVEREARDLTAAWVPGDPEPGWAFSYDIPAGMLAARYLTTFEEFDISFDDASKNIVANVGGTVVPDDQPILVYTADVTDPLLLDPDLYQGLIFALAANIAMPLTNKTGKIQTLISLTNSYILTARANSANEMARLFQQTPASLQARGYVYGMQTPFVQSYGPMFSATGAPLI